ncbi:protein SRC2-like [Chenopodium quinoa]|uniref:protein SRC2-like n=1 Tax=Chenopodium quinoa TaxID=63459 RepID=UPI000B7858CD|nr:protein SRC2-like [Chenopodium quinoa]
MEFRTLDLTVLSANDLNRVNLFSKMDVYVVVSVINSAVNRRSTALKQRTPIDKKGDKNPSWNYPINFTINDAAAMHNRLTIRFQVFSKRIFPGDKLIGEVLVPVSELLSSHGDRKQASSLSYQLRKVSGKPKGVLNFSYKFGEKFTAGGGVGEGFTVGGTGPTTYYSYPPPQQQPMWGQPVSGYPAQPPTAYPYQGHGHGYGYGHGYPSQTQSMGIRRNNNFGMGMGAGLLGGALAGMVIGDLVSDGGYDGGFDGGYDGGFDGGFDF